MKRFTVVVVTWNSAGEIPGLLESVERHLGRECELLFVDNHSTDDTVGVIRASSPWHHVVQLSRNSGYAAASNVGVRAATTNVVVLLNPDTLMVDDSLSALAELASRERALFAPRLLNADGSTQISARPAVASWESALVSIWPGGLMPRRLRMRCEPWRFDQRLPAGWISGACLAAQRDLLLELGPFDERLVLYGEDADLCLRGWQAGYPSVSAPDMARVVHLGNRSTSQVFTDVGMQRKIEGRWWVVHERVGPVRGRLDLTAEFLLYGLRWLAKRVLLRDAAVEATWLRAALRAMRARRPPAPHPLPNIAAAREPS